MIKVDNYIKIKTIGKGTFGSVNLVERKIDKKQFAIKKIYLSNENYKQVHNEIKILASLNHPQIIKYQEYFITQNKIYIVTDYYSHGDLSEFIKKHKKQNRNIPEKFIYQCLTQINKALLYLHEKNILHRDLKAQNILLDANENVIIADFGISKQLNDKNELANTSLGTPYFLSPEICKNSKYDHKTDMWMLGCILYELLTLKKPFKGESLNSIINNILFTQPDPVPTIYNPKFNQIVQMLLQKQPEKRISAYQLDIYLNQREIKIEKNIFDSKSPTNDQIRTPSTIESAVQKKKVQISINTQNLSNQRLGPESDKLGLHNIANDEFSENRPKSFTFGKQIFDGNMPTSPQRQILFQEFLKKRLGEGVFEMAMKLLASQKNPFQFLSEENPQLIEIIGQDNKETIKCFKMILMQPQQTPTKRFNFNNYKN